MAVGFGRETRDLCLLFPFLSSPPGCPYVLRCCFYAGNALPLIASQTSDCFPASPFKGLPGIQTSVSKLLTLPPLPTLSTLAKILLIPSNKMQPSFHCCLLPFTSSFHQSPRPIYLVCPTSLWNLSVSLPPHCYRPCSYVSFTPRLQLLLARLSLVCPPSAHIQKRNHSKFKT